VDISLNASGYKNGNMIKDDLATFEVSERIKDKINGEDSFSSPTAPTPDPAVMNTAPLVIDAEKDENVGKVRKYLMLLVCTRTVCSIVGIREPSISLYKHLFQSCLAKEFIIARIEQNPSLFLNIEALCDQKREELTAFAQNALTIDIMAIFDSLFPIISSQTTVSPSFNGI
jgi:hypothetical protein